MFPVADDAFNYISPYYFTLYRYIPVTIILVIALLIFEGKKAFNTNGQGLILWMFGIMGFVFYNLLIFVGQDMIGDDGVLIASIMEGAAPIISIIVMWIAYKHKPSLFTFITIIVAFIGVYFVVTNGDASLLIGDNRLFPLFVLFIAALGWAVYTIGGGHFNKWSVLRYSTLSVLYGTATAVVVVLIGSLFGLIPVPTMEETLSVKYHMAYMIILPGVIALLGWNKAVQILTPINAILFINFAPVTTIVISVIQGHAIGTSDIIGVALVILSIIANNMYDRYVNNKIVTQHEVQPTKHKSINKVNYIKKSRSIFMDLLFYFIKTTYFVALKKSLIKNTSPTRILRDIKRTRFEKKFDQNGFILCEVLYIFLKKV